MLKANSIIKRKWSEYKGTVEWTSATLLYYRSEKEVYLYLFHDAGAASHIQNWIVKAEQRTRIVKDTVENGENIQKRSQFNLSVLLHYRSQEVCFYPSQEKHVMWA